MTTREQILQALMGILEGLKASHGVLVVERNRTTDPDVSPTVVLMDGTEDPPNAQRPFRPGMPWIVTMRPEIVAVVDGTDEEIGTRMNEMLAALHKSVFVDGFRTLSPLIGQEGSLMRGRVETAAKRGEPTVGFVSMEVMITYICNPNK